MVPFSVPRPWKEYMLIAGPAAEPHVAARRHVGRVGGEDQVELDGDVGQQRLRRGQRAAQVELLLHREDEMHRRPLLHALQRARHLDHHRAAGAVVDRGAGDAGRRRGRGPAAR